MSHASPLRLAAAAAAASASSSSSSSTLSPAPGRGVRVVVRVRPLFLHEAQSGDHAALRVLPEIRAAVGDLALMLDGGVRRGTDILKAIALGADFVFVGRSFNYATAVAGEAGVLHAAGLLAKELHADMGLLNLNSLAEIGPRYLLRLKGLPHQRST